MKSCGVAFSVAVRLAALIVSLSPGPFKKGEASPPSRRDSTVISAFMAIRQTQVAVMVAVVDFMSLKVSKTCFSTDYIDLLVFSIDGS